MVVNKDPVGGARDKSQLPPYRAVACNILHNCKEELAYYVTLHNNNSLSGPPAAVYFAKMAFTAPLRAHAYQVHPTATVLGGNNLWQ